MILCDHSDRDEIKRRGELDFLALFDEHRGRRHGKALFCPFHANSRTPAASIHNGRFKCFSCGMNLDVIEFIQQVRCEDFKGALAFLGARYGVCTDGPVLSPGDRARWAEQHRQVQQSLPTARYWKFAAIRLSEELLGELKRGLDESAKVQPEIGELMHLTAILVRLQRLDGTTLVDEWRDWRRRNPALTDAITATACARQRAAQRTFSAFMLGEEAA